MILIGLSLFSLFAAALPALMTLANRRWFTTLPSAEGESLPPVSILIPARNESEGIEATLRAALDSHGTTIEVLVLDDHSTDDTVERVTKVAAAAPQLRLHRSRSLPDGWNGKQHACHQLAEQARYDLLLFIDADVRLAPDAVARLASEMQRRPELGLLSLFPWQVTGTFWERLLIPLMHFILLGFLPFRQMQQSTSPAFAAGCGQLFCARRAAYQQSGGHAAIRASRHDGVKLPRVFREADWLTDCLDGTDTARCRMYTSTGEVMRGLLKNATEGIANPRVILFFTSLLLGGAVLPFVLLSLAIAQGNSTAAVISAVAAGLAYLPRLLNALWLRQSWLGFLFQPLAVAVFVALQWTAFIGALVGYRPRWRGRQS